MFSASPAPLTRPEFHHRSSSDDHHALKGNPRPNSGFFGGHNPSSSYPGQVQRISDGTESETPFSAVPEAVPRSGPMPRRKSLLRKRRSVFGSLRSQNSLDDGDASGRRSKVSSIGDDDSSLGIGCAVLHHGEVQTTGGMWRKKSQYLVLTDTHLIRFKSQNKALDAFPSIAASFTHALPGSRQSSVSIGSMQDIHMVAHDTAAGISLSSIIAVYALDDGRLSSIIEVAYLDERTHKTALIQMHMPDPQELNLWMTGIRSAARFARSVNPLPIDQMSVDYVVSVLEHEKDYDPVTFRLFRVLQMASTKSSGGSSEDLTKLSPTGCYLAVGSHKIHLIPLHKASHRGSLTSSSDLDAASLSFGLMTLTGLSMEWGDDSLHLTFRIPLCKPFSVFLASVHATEIALWIRQYCEFLRPLWINQPCHFITPRELDNEDNLLPLSLMEEEEDYGCFDRTLVAYSAGYDIDTSNIRYTIDMQCDDAPCFKLLPPASLSSQNYTALELIAVMRALRYNDSFRTISFSGVSLDALRGIRDPYGPDKDAFTTRAGSRVSIPGQENLSVLSQEIRALALKSKWLRRLDFSYCLKRTPSSDTGCDIPEAIFPIIRRELLTCVDWVALNGIKLGESDLDYLVDAASQRGSHLRALEVGNCGLSIHNIDLLLSTIVAQESTLEAIDISGMQGRLSPDTLQQYFGYFNQLRKVDLSCISRTSGPDPLITKDMLFNWQLEELSLNRTTVNRETTRSIAAYLASDKSRSLRVLQMNQCGLTGEDVAMLLRSIASNGGARRNLHVYVNENRLDTGCPHLSDAIARNQTPSLLSMRMIDFKREEHFRQLVEAVRNNKSLKFLDISKASLPYDAGPETCKSLQMMFEDNDTLEDLDISGDSAHLDVARFGIGLNLALTGLKKNKSLKVLRIEHQKLGFQGASTLASVLEENTCLREVHCENNEMNLQSFTVLVNGLEKNNSLFILSCMDGDRIRSLERIRREMESLTRESSRRPQNPPTGSSTTSLRRTIYAAVGQVGGGNKLTKNANSATNARNGHPSIPARISPPSSELLDQPASQEIERVLLSLTEKWDSEVVRLHGYLSRNYNLAHGLDEKSYEDIGVGYIDEKPFELSLATDISPRMSLDYEKFLASSEVPPAPISDAVGAAGEMDSRPLSPLMTEPQTSEVPTGSSVITSAAEAKTADVTDSSLRGALSMLNRNNAEEKKEELLFDSEFAASFSSIRHDIKLDEQWRPKTAPLSPTHPPAPASTLPGSSRGHAQPPTNGAHKPGSARSASGSATSNSTGSSSRSLYPSALKGLVSKSASREKKRMEKLRNIKPISNESNVKSYSERQPNPPQLDWSPPKLDLSFSST